MSVLPKEALDVAGAGTKQPMGSSIMTTAQGTNTGAFDPLDWLLFLSIGCIWGSSFCVSAFNAFWLIFRNLARIVAVTGVTGFLSLIGKVKF